MTKQLEILVIEDNPKHLADAKSAAQQYNHIGFAYASTQQEAEQLIAQNKYDAVVTDVFFPAREGEEPTSDAGLEIGKKVDALGIPFVYNSSRNHHGLALGMFIKEIIDIWPNYGFGTGKVIEGYPQKDIDAESDTKQWSAAINFAILLTGAKDIDQDVQEEVSRLLNFTAYCDGGSLTEYMRTVLNKPLAKERAAVGCGDHSTEKYNRALNFIRNVLCEYTK